MSLLVRDTLKSADDHAVQIAAMKALVAGLRSEGVSGSAYSCFFPETAAEFVGILEFADDAGRQAFLTSAAFATYRETVGPIFANPPQRPAITAIASTRR